MKRIYLTALAVVMSCVVYAQNERELSFYAIDGNTKWFKLYNTEGLDQSDVIAIYKDQFLTAPNSILELEKEYTDKFGIQHFIYQQYHQGVYVEGGKIALHIDADGTMRLNGRVINDLPQVNDALSAEQALDAALASVNSENYFWNDPARESELKYVRQDQNASYYPYGNLRFSANKESVDAKDFTLNWKFEIHVNPEYESRVVYVNAENGTLSYSRDLIHTESVEGTAQTRYHGEHDLMTDSVASDEFRLFDDSRGLDIHTKNCETETISFSDAVEFTDEDNYWDNANAAMDDAAGDVHWGMQMTWDYFKFTHDQNSFDDLGAAMLSRVHYDLNYFNAFWNGTLMTFGDGSNNPLTSIDVVGHEFQHGVTGNMAASNEGLVYQGESGALNESFSDVFGTAIEFWALGDSADYFVGVENFLLRDMSDPNEGNDPDTYDGAFWKDTSPGASDNGGVHSNSGVQNYWYYLLAEGGSGVNDNGDAFDVEGIGRVNAELIAFRNLTVYLTDLFAPYADARIGAVQAAADIFGECSWEVEQTLKAWHAVGLGYPDFSKDIVLDEVELPASDCYLTDSESIDISFTYYYLGCDEVLEAGESITLGYVDNDGTPIIEEMILTEDLSSGDVVNYTFENVDLSEDGLHTIDVFIYNSSDLINENDSIFSSKVTKQVVFDESMVVGFESSSLTPDSISEFRANLAIAKVSSTADNTGSRGYLLSGEYDPDNPPWGFFLPEDEDENFSSNEAFFSEVCVCLESLDMETVFFAFDMKQFYSAYWMDQEGEDIPELVSSARVMVDGVQVGDQYHPTTYEDDPYLTYYVDITEYVTDESEVCIQGKHFVSKQNDLQYSESEGDKTYLDNWRFIDNAALSVSELTHEGSINIFPNPAKDKVFVDLKDMDGQTEIRLFDLLGKQVQAHSFMASPSQLIELDLSELNDGMYLLQLQNKGERIQQTFVKN